MRLRKVRTDGRTELYGVETAEVYQANLDVYRRSYQQRIRLKEELEKLAQALPRLRRDPSLLEKANLLGKDIEAVHRLINAQTISKDIPTTLNQVLGSVDRMKQVLPKDVADSLLETLSAGTHFYAFALMRDQDMFENTMVLRRQTGQTTTVLITGGFHTKGLCEQFKKAGLSYVIITPTVRKNDTVDQKLYVERLLDHHLTPEQVAQGLDWAAMDQLEPALNLFRGALKLWSAGLTYALKPLRLKAGQALVAGVVAAGLALFPSCSPGLKEKTGAADKSAKEIRVDIDGNWLSANGPDWHAVYLDLNDEQKKQLNDLADKTDEVQMVVALRGIENYYVHLQIYPQDEPNDGTDKGILPPLHLGPNLTRTSYTLTPKEVRMRRIALQNGPKVQGSDIGNEGHSAEASIVEIRFVGTPKKGALLPGNNVFAVAPQPEVKLTPDQKEIQAIGSKASHAFQDGSYVRSAYYESKLAVLEQGIKGTLPGSIAFLSFFLAGLFFYGRWRLNRRGSATGLSMVSMAIMAGLLMPAHLISQVKQPAAKGAPQGAPAPIRTLQDGVNFILRQRPIVDGKPGLPATFYVGQGVTISDPDKNNIGRQGVGLYDTAIAIMVLDAGGRSQEGQEIIDIYASGKYGNMELRAFPNSDNVSQENPRGAFLPFSETLHYYFDFTRVTGRWGPEWRDWKSHTGPNAWFANALARHMLKPGMNLPRNMQLLRKLGDAMILMQQPDQQIGQTTQGGIRFGPQGQYFAPGPTTNGAPYLTINSENVVSAESFNWIAAVTQDGKYSRGALNLENWLFDADVFNPATGRTQKGMLDPEFNLIYVGANWNSTARRWEIELDPRTRQPLFAEDSAGSWTLSALGPAKIDQRRGPGTAFKMWLGVRARFGKTTDYRRVGPNDEMAGVDFSDFFPNQGVITREWTRGYLNGTNKVVEYYAGRPTPGVDLALPRRDQVTVARHLSQMSNAYMEGPGTQSPRNAATGFGWEGIPGDNRGAAMASVTDVLPFDPLEAPANIPAPIATPALAPAPQPAAPKPQAQAPAAPQAATPQGQQQAEGTLIGGPSFQTYDDGITHTEAIANPGDLSRFRSATLKFTRDQVGTKFYARIIPQRSDYGSEDGTSLVTYTVGSDGTAADGSPITIISLDPSLYRRRDARYGPPLTARDLTNPRQFTLSSGSNPYGKYPLDQPASRHAHVTEMRGSTNLAPRRAAVETPQAAPEVAGQAAQTNGVLAEFALNEDFGEGVHRSFKEEELAGLKARWMILTIRPTESFHPSDIQGLALELHGNRLPTVSFRAARVGQSWSMDADSRFFINNATIDENESAGTFEVYVDMDEAMIKMGQSEYLSDLFLYKGTSEGNARNIPSIVTVKFVDSSYHSAQNVQQPDRAALTKPSQGLAVDAMEMARLEGKVQSLQNMLNSAGGVQRRTILGQFNRAQRDLTRAQEARQTMFAQTSAPSVAEVQPREETPASGAPTASVPVGETRKGVPLEEILLRSEYQHTPYVDRLGAWFKSVSMPTLPRWVKILIAGVGLPVAAAAAPLIDGSTSMTSIIGSPVAVLIVLMSLGAILYRLGSGKIWQAATHTQFLGLARLFRLDASPEPGVRELMTTLEKFQPVRSARLGWTQVRIGKVLIALGSIPLIAYLLALALAFLDSFMPRAGAAQISNGESILNHVVFTPSPEAAAMIVASIGLLSVGVGLYLLRSYKKYPALSERLQNYYMAKIYLAIGLGLFYLIASPVAYAIGKYREKHENITHPTTSSIIFRSGTQQNGSRAGHDFQIIPVQLQVEQRTTQAGPTAGFETTFTETIPEDAAMAPFDSPTEHSVGWKLRMPKATADFTYLDIPVFGKKGTKVVARFVSDSRHVNDPTGLLYEAITLVVDGWNTIRIPAGRIEPSVFFEFDAHAGVYPFNKIHLNRTKQDLQGGRPSFTRLAPSQEKTFNKRKITVFPTPVPAANDVAGKGDLVASAGDANFSSPGSVANNGESIEAVIQREFPNMPLIERFRNFFVSPRTQAFGILFSIPFLYGFRWLDGSTASGAADFFSVGAIGLGLTYLVIRRLRRNKFSNRESNVLKSLGQGFVAAGLLSGLISFGSQQLVQKEVQQADKEELALYSSQQSFGRRLITNEVAERGRDWIAAKLPDIELFDMSDLQGFEVVFPKPYPRLVECQIEYYDADGKWHQTGTYLGNYLVAEGLFDQNPKFGLRRFGISKEGLKRVSRIIVKFGGEGARADFLRIDGLISNSKVGPDTNPVSPPEKHAPAEKRMPGAARLIKTAAAVVLGLGLFLGQLGALKAQTSQAPQAKLSLIALLPRPLKIFGALLGFSSIAGAAPVVNHPAFALVAAQIAHYAPLAMLYISPALYGLIFPVILLVAGGFFLYLCRRDDKSLDEDKSPGNTLKILASVLIAFGVGLGAYQLSQYHGRPDYQRGARLYEHYQGSAEPHNSWLGYWEHVDPAQSDRILKEKFLQYEVRPNAGPSAFGKLTGFHVDVHGGNTEDQDAGDVYGLYVKKVEDQWVDFLDSEDKPQNVATWKTASGARVDVDARQGALIVTIPMAEVKKALDEEHYKLITSIHGQTGEQHNGLTFNLKNVPSNITVRAFSPIETVPVPAAAAPAPTRGISVVVPARLAAFQSGPAAEWELANTNINDGLYVKNHYIQLGIEADSFRAAERVEFVIQPNEIADFRKLKAIRVSVLAYGETQTGYKAGEYALTVKKVREWAFVPNGTDATVMENAQQGTITISIPMGQLLKVFKGEHLRFYGVRAETGRHFENDADNVNDGVIPSKMTVRTVWSSSTPSRASVIADKPVAAGQDFQIIPVQLQVEQRTVQAGPETRLVETFTETLPEDAAVAPFDNATEHSVGWKLRTPKATADFTYVDIPVFGKKGTKVVTRFVSDSRHVNDPTGLLYEAITLVVDGWNTIRIPAGRIEPSVFFEFDAHAGVYPFNKIHLNRTKQDLQGGRPSFTRLAPSQEKTFNKRKITIFPTPVPAANDVTGDGNRIASAGATSTNPSLITSAMPQLKMMGILTAAVLGLSSLAGAAPLRAQAIAVPVSPIDSLLFFLAGVLVVGWGVKEMRAHARRGLLLTVFGLILSTAGAGGLLGADMVWWAGLAGFLLMLAVPMIYWAVVNRLRISLQLRTWLRWATVPITVGVMRLLHSIPTSMENAAIIGAVVGSLVLFSRWLTWWRVPHVEDSIVQRRDVWALDHPNERDAGYLGNTSYRFNFSYVEGRAMLRHENLEIRITNTDVVKTIEVSIPNNTGQFYFLKIGREGNSSYIRNQSGENLPWAMTWDASGVKLTIPMEAVRQHLGNVQRFENPLPWIEVTPEYDSDYRYSWKMTSEKFPRSSPPLVELETQPNPISARTSKILSTVTGVVLGLPVLGVLSDMVLPRAGAAMLPVINHPALALALAQFQVSVPFWGVILVLSVAYLIGELIGRNAKKSEMGIKLFTTLLAVLAIFGGVHVYTAWKAKNAGSEVSKPTAQQVSVPDAAQISGVRVVRTDKGVWLNVHGQLWSGVPGISYQPVPDGAHINDFEHGRMRYLYRALLPNAEDMAKDPEKYQLLKEKYPDLIQLALEKPSGHAALAQNQGQTLHDQGYKVIRTYNLAATTPEDGAVVNRLFEWLGEEHGVGFIAGMYAPTEAQVRFTANTYSKNPWLILVDGWNEINLREANPNYGEIDRLAGVYKSIDPNHPVALVVVQALRGDDTVAIPAMKNIDFPSVTIYDREGDDAANLVRRFQKTGSAPGGIFAPNGLMVGEIGVGVDVDSQVRAQRLQGIASALTTVNPVAPAPSLITIYFEATFEEWKGGRPGTGDNRWAMFGTPSAEAVARVNRRWVPGPAAAREIPLVSAPRKATGAQKFKSIALLATGFLGISVLANAQTTAIPLEFSPGATFPNPESMRAMANVHQFSGNVYGDIISQIIGGVLGISLFYLAFSFLGDAMALRYSRGRERNDNYAGSFWNAVFFSVIGFIMSFISFFAQAGVNLSRMTPAFIIGGLGLGLLSDSLLPRAGAATLIPTLFADQNIGLTVNGLLAIGFLVAYLYMRLARKNKGSYVLILAFFVQLLGVFFFWWVGSHQSGQDSPQIQPGGQAQTGKNYEPAAPQNDQSVPETKQPAKIEWQPLRGQLTTPYDNPGASQGAEHASGMLAVNDADWDLSAGMVQLTFTNEVPVGTEFTIRIINNNEILGSQSKGPVYTVRSGETRVMVINLNEFFELYSVTPAQVNHVKSIMVQSADFAYTAHLKNDKGGVNGRIDLSGIAVPKKPAPQAGLFLLEMGKDGIAVLRNIGMAAGLVLAAVLGLSHLLIHTASQAPEVASTFRQIQQMTVTSAGMSSPQTVYQWIIYLSIFAAMIYWQHSNRARLQEAVADRAAEILPRLSPENAAPKYVHPVMDYMPDYLAERVQRWLMMFPELARRFDDERNHLGFGAIIAAA